MRTIIHLSDLHFGRTQESLIAPLLDLIQKRNPDLVVVSGDLTQRAKESQFLEAQKFLAQISSPKLVVPGNHDIPLGSVFTRLINPYKRYKQYIAKNLEPEFVGQEIAVKGINSVRLFSKEGIVNKKQLVAAEKLFDPLGPKVVKIIVSHHPFNVPASHIGKPLMRAKRALKQFEETGVDLLLSGHLHEHMHSHQDAPFKIEHRGPLIVSAGSAISTRLREEPNSFNIITIDYPAVTIERFENVDGVINLQSSSKLFLSE